MQIYTAEQPNQSIFHDGFSLRETAVALGGFDAIHIGHQAIIRNVVAKAKAEGLSSVVSLFRNLPRNVILGGDTPPVYPLEKRLALLEDLGVDIVIAQWFTPEYKEILPEVFVEEYLKQRLDARYVAVGFNYHFGKNGAGNRTTLKTLCQPMGIEVCGIDAVTIDDAIVSSTRIRELLQQGNMIDAARCLGRPFSLTGTVIAGNRLGRAMGFPTANIACPKTLILPKFGVYFSRVKANGAWYTAICNVGARPTVADDTPWIEAHLLDFEGDLYGKEIEIVFCDSLREIQAFENPEALAKQLAKDKLCAENYFKQ